jgi:hypothetical protein
LSDFAVNEADNASFLRIISYIISSEHIQEWILAPIKGNLNEVPGIGPANIAHFGTVYEDNKYAREFFCRIEYLMDTLLTVVTILQYCHH